MTATVNDSAASTVTEPFAQAHEQLDDLGRRPLDERIAVISALNDEMANALNELDEI